MEAVNVLHMNGGNGYASYAKNSSLQEKGILMTKPMIDEAIIDVYCKLLYPKKLYIADLGCSSGPNIFLVVSELIKTIDKTCKKMNLPESPEFDISLNDLYGNDFNAVFESLPLFKENLRKEMGYGFTFTPWFINGVPGSFYERLFPTNSLHFVHSSYSLHWLSQVPEGVENNKGNIYMSKTSPPNVLKAYYEQFEKDFMMFLKFRSVELMSGGRMVITFLGRESDDPCSKEGCYIWELLARVLNQMVSEGTIQEKALDSFNVPIYSPSSSDVKVLIESEGSFRIDRLEVSRADWSGRSNDGAYNMAKSIRAVVEPLLVSHFGEAIIDEVFCKYKKILSEYMLKEKIEIISVTASVTKKI